MYDEAKTDQLCDLFLQIINQYGQVEKQLHGSDSTLHLSEIHTIAMIGTRRGWNITALARKQGISKSAVSQMAAKLADKGYIVKRPSPETDNEVLLELTDSGKQICEEHDRQHHQLREQLAVVFEKYSPDTLDDLTALAKDLQQLWTSLL